MDLSQRATDRIVLPGTPEPRLRGLATQEYMKRMLEKHYEVLLASSARKAHRHLRDHGDEIGVILMDLSLQGDEDGLTLTRNLRRDESCGDIPVIAVTAHAFPADERNALAAGCDRYLAKPVDPKTLLSVIEDMIESKPRRPTRGEKPGE